MSGLSKKTFALHALPPKQLKLRRFAFKQITLLQNMHCEAWLTALQIDLITVFNSLCMNH